MTGRIDAAVELFERSEVAMTLAIRHGVSDPAAVARFTRRAVPLVSEAIDRRLEEDGAVELARAMAEVDRGERVAAIGSFTTGAHEAVGFQVVRHLMADLDGRRRLARELTDDSVDASAATGLLAAVAWACAGERTSAPVDGHPPVPEIAGATLVSAPGVGRAAPPGPDATSNGTSVGASNGLTVAASNGAIDDAGVDHADRARGLTPPDRPSPLPSALGGPGRSHHRDDEGDDPEGAAESDDESVEADIPLGPSLLVVGLAAVLVVLLALSVGAWVLDGRGLIDLGELESLGF